MYSRTSVERGSVLFETPTMYSDRDILHIVPDKYKSFLFENEKGILEHTWMDGSGVVIDEQFVCESDFQKLVDKYDVNAIETLCTPTEHILGFDEKCNIRIKLPLDKWKVRQSFSSTASNSWAKAHKKMTVEKDLDMYRGAKSLFHSLRILMFANQICENGKIVDFKEANDYWWEIYKEFLDKKDWEYFKEKYRPIYNGLRSKLAVLAPKPV